MKHLMLDLETIGTTLHAPIMQVGMCYFDIGKALIKAEYEVCIELQPQLDRGAKTDGDTIMWWMMQGQDARKAMFAADQYLSPSIAFSEVNQFLADADRIWSHATFDFVLLREAMRRHGIQPLFHYRKGMDIRTLTTIAKLGRNEVYKKYPNTGTHHTALADCRYQVQYVSDCWNKIQRGLND